MENFQKLVDAAEAVYFEATKKYKEVMMWDKVEKFIPLTSRDIDTFEESFGATQSSVKSAFAACERLSELLKELRLELEVEEQEIKRRKYFESDTLDTDNGDFRTDAEREAGIPKRGYF